MSLPGLTWAIRVSSTFVDFLSTLWGPLKRLSAVRPPCRVLAAAWTRGLAGHQHCGLSRASACLHLEFLSVEERGSTVTEVPQMGEQPQPTMSRFPGGQICSVLWAAANLRPQLRAGAKMEKCTLKPEKASVVLAVTTWPLFLFSKCPRAAGP